MTIGLLIASAAMNMAGAIGSAQAQKAAGKAGYAASVFESTLAGRNAEVMEQQAGQSRAASQRAAIEDRRQATLTSSRSRALAGASASDVGVIRHIGDVEYEGELRALTSMYQGEERARGLEYGAELERARGRGLVYGGQVSKDLSKSAATQTLLSGAGTSMGMFSNYDFGGGSYTPTVYTPALKKRFG